MKKIFTIAIIAILGLVLQSNTPKKVTVSFQVSAVCGLCEETIEKALDMKGVVAADYNLETGIATVTYKPSKIEEKDLHAALNEVGYDTEKSKATDEQYARTHNCCKYREQEKH
jgi:copper chaperone CopZ